jgi:hypothetical protein
VCVCCYLCLFLRHDLRFAVLLSEKSVKRAVSQSESRTKIRSKVIQSQRDAIIISLFLISSAGFLRLLTIVIGALRLFLSKLNHEILFRAEIENRRK